ncbi:MAG: DUF3054 domain-containing protein [Corynebacterium sp.]|uniref:DUF3054 domain-containing protein n=1 Tax=Corynebacterium sp. TaxID=1720 RepID=UPI0026DBF981|nr:DUF3054 domain-containing protein [Corynebacterium sp.]MDO4761171.1 DUF3054 domain-containing protein [Corynebacterium sp.]
MKTLFKDILATFVFAVLARLAHGGLSVPAVLDTWWPFALGALAAGAVIFAFGHDGTTWRSGVIVWGLCTVVGLKIWAFRHGEIPHISFIIVATIMSGLLILGWRGVEKLLAKRT